MMAVLGSVQFCEVSKLLSIEVILTAAVLQAEGRACPERSRRDLARPGHAGGHDDSYRVNMLPLCNSGLPAEAKFRSANNW
jgi:hypothetical protein